MTSEKTDRRRQYSAAVKAQVVAECDGTGASVAKVAMSHGINANVVHRWRQLAREGKLLVPAKTDELMPVPPAAPTVTTKVAKVRVDLRAARRR